MWVSWLKSLGQQFSNSFTHLSLIAILQLNICAPFNKTDDSILLLASLHANKILPCTNDSHGVPRVLGLIPYPPPLKICY